MLFKKDFRLNIQFTLQCSGKAKENAEGDNGLPDDKFIKLCCRKVAGKLPVGCHERSESQHYLVAGVNSVNSHYVVVDGVWSEYLLLSF
ncbi:hypothetical protein [Saccharobesus litoralis]|uniref:hypothetical protein n=1 Tax=Saccharobesus litoralis TaxID=2172099 RepID=UPI00131F3E08|nr:hypothetical protein [Saccharobesus litoralis]